MKTPEQMAEEYAANVERVPILFYKPEVPCKNAFLAGYEARKNEETPHKRPAGWISVRERLPEPNVVVRAFINYMLDGERVQEVTEAAFRDGLWVGDGVKITHPLVSHWKPLNQTQKENEDENT